MAYRPSLGSLPAGFAGSVSGLSALEQSGAHLSDTHLANPSAVVGPGGAYRPPQTPPVNPYAAATTPPAQPGAGDAAVNFPAAPTAQQQAKAVPPPYQPPALAICTFVPAAVPVAASAAAASPLLTPTKPGGSAPTPTQPVATSPLLGYSPVQMAAGHSNSPACVIPGLARISARPQHSSAAELASAGSSGGGRGSQTGLSTVGLPPALVAAKATALGGSGAGSRPLSTHPSRGPSNDGMAQLLPHSATFPSSTTTSQAAAYNPLLMAMSAGAAVAANTSRSSTPPLVPTSQPLPPEPTPGRTTAASDSFHVPTPPPSAPPPLPPPQQQLPAVPVPASLSAPDPVPAVSTVPAAPLPVRPGSHLPTPVVVGRLPQPVLADAAPVPIITSAAAAQPLRPGDSAGDDGDGSKDNAAAAAVARRQLAIQLAEMMGDNVDVATCLDVLEQVDGDEGRAAAALLELCGGGVAGVASGGNASSGRLAVVAQARPADAATEGGVFGGSAEAEGFFAAADGFGAAAAGPSADSHVADEGFLGLAPGFGDAAIGGTADVAATGSSAAAFDFSSPAGGSPTLGSGAEHMRAALLAAGLSCDDEGLAQLYQQQEEIEEQRRRERLQQQIAADEAKVAELQQQEARAARERERKDAQSAAVAMEEVALGAGQDAWSAWGSSGSTGGGAATQATGYFGAADDVDTDAFFTAPDEEGAENKHDIMKIYFGNVYDEDALRFCLEACHGDVDMALEVLGEQWVEAKKQEQQEADEKYARALQQQHSTGGAALDAVGDSLLEDYMIHAAEGLADVAEAQSRQEARQQAEAASRRGRLGSDAEGRNRLGLTVLRRQFPDAYKDGVVADALSSHGGDVEAARTALLAMGYCEVQAAAATPAASQAATATASLPLSSAQQRHPAPPSHRQQQRRSGAVPVAAGVGGGRYSDDEGEGMALVSHRGQAQGQQWRLEGGGLPGNAAVLGPAGAGRNAGANSAAAQRAAQLAQLAAAYPSGEAAAAMAAARNAQAQDAGAQDQRGAHHDEEDEELDAEGGGTGPSTSAGAAGGYRRLGPIKALASLGLNFDQLNVSNELRDMVRFAFNESGLPEVFRRQAEAEATAAAQSSGGSGRRMGYGLTHEEKQEIWATNRDLPRALQDMAARLKRGGREAYQAGDKRLAGEMKQASLAVEQLKREAEERAASRIYTQMNNSLQQQWNTDLHGLRPHEAVKQLEDQLHKLSILGGHVNWNIITGKGLHSDTSVGPVLPTTVADWLARKQLQALAAPGSYVVRLTPEVFERLAGGAVGGGPAGAAAGGGGVPGGAV